MTDTTKPRKTRVPRNYDSILKGAMELTLQDQVKLVIELKKDITVKVETAEKNAAEAKQTVNGL